LRHNAKHRKEPHAKYNPQDLEHDPSTKTDTQKGFDFSTLESDILKSIERMTHRLAELRAGGRLNPTTLEALQVNLDKSSSSRVKLKDIAQVVSKGQYLHVILSDEEVYNKKAIWEASMMFLTCSDSMSSPSNPRFKAPTSP
jgi:ribosome recycling factor